jgi:hypothetical protein
VSVRDLMAMRDQLDKGDEVLVRTNAAPDSPRYRGIVVEVMGRAARVEMVRDGKIRVVPLAKLSKVFDTSSTLPQPLRETVLDMRLYPKPVVQAAAVQLAQHTRSVIAEVVPVGEVLPKQDDVTAWLDMGKALVGQLTIEAEELNQQARDILADAEEYQRICQQQASEYLAEAKAKLVKLDLLTKLTK